MSLSHLLDSHVSLFWNTYKPIFNSIERTYIGNQVFLIISKKTIKIQEFERNEIFIEKKFELKRRLGSKVIEVVSRYVRKILRTKQ